MGAGNVFFSAIAAGALVTALSLWLMRALGKLDQPDSRRTHQQPTPRAGALGIFLICLGYAWQNPGEQLWLIPAVAGLGLLDDFIPQPASLRLLLQFAICTVAVVSMGDVWPHGPVLLIRIALIVGAVAIINAANFFDGRNGLLSGNFVVVLLLLPFIGVHWLSALALAGLWLGFLPFNFPRARIFMGDVGSYLIGATLAWLWLSSTQVSGASSLAFLVACSAILADPVLTLLSRAARGKKVWQAHREHLYQWLYRIGFSDLKLLGLTLVYAGTSFLLAHFIVMQTNFMAFWLTFAWSVICAVAWLAARRALLTGLRSHRGSK